MKRPLPTGFDSRFGRFVNRPYNSQYASYSTKNSPDQTGQGSFHLIAYSSAKSYTPSYFSRNMLNRVVSSSSLSTPL